MGSTAASPRQAHRVLGVKRARASLLELIDLCMERKTLKELGPEEPHSPWTQSRRPRGRELRSLGDQRVHFVCGMTRIVAGGQTVQAAFPKMATMTSPPPHVLLHDDASSVLSFAWNPENLWFGQKKASKRRPLTWKSLSHHI